MEIVFNLSLVLIVFVYGIGWVCFVMFLIIVIVCCVENMECVRINLIYIIVFVIYSG